MDSKLIVGSVTAGGTRQALGFTGINTESIAPRKWRNIALTIPRSSSTTILGTALLGMGGPLKSTWMPSNHREESAPSAESQKALEVSGEVRNDPSPSIMTTPAAPANTGAANAKGVCFALSATILYICSRAIQDGQREPQPISPSMPDRLFTTNIRNKFKCHKIEGR